MDKIINNKGNALQELLPNKLNRPLRRRGHEFELNKNNNNNENFI